MPTVNVDPDELRRLTGHDEKDDDELKDDLFSLGLEFEGRTEDGDLQLEFEPDRLDRLSVEGIARSLRYQYGEDRGVYVPDTNDAEWTIEVEEVPDQRPYVTGAVARGIDLDEDVLDSIIQLQEKLHATMGRQRRKGAIGIHDLAMLKGRALSEVGDAADADEEGGAGAAADAEPEPPDRRHGDSPDVGATEGTAQKAVRYTGIGADEDSFVPLDADSEMTPAEVLAEHPTGETYADIVADYDSMPAIYDEIGLFSFPPVINGKRTEVDTGSRDLFVEMTGTDQWTVDKMLNIVCYALDARGAQIEDVTVEYPDRDVYADPDVDLVEPGATLVRPDFSTKTKTVTHERIESMLGIDLETDAVVDLLERSGLDASVEEQGDGEIAYEATIPPYRVDVLHPWDVVDDVGRAYGFNELEPRYPDVSTVGKRHETSRLEEAVRNALVGLGFEDTLNFHLTSPEENYERLGVERPERSDGDGASGDSRERGSDVLGGGDAAVIKEPYSEDYEIVRTWALPSLLLLLENNTHRSYPQDVAEVGFAAEQDPAENTGLAERTTVAGAMARHDVSYEDVKGRLQALARVFEVDLETPATEHPAFLDGRTAEVVVDGESAGVVGEVHPRVLVDHDMEVPVAAFEFDLDALR